MTKPIGAWHVEHHDSSRVVFTDRLEIRNERGQMIAALHAVNFDMDGEQDTYHANLLGEAPAMRDLIRRWITWDASSPDVSRQVMENFCHEARALLARIDGEIPNG